MDREPSVYRDPSLKGKSLFRRYMDLAKFVDPLRSRSLYLRRVDCFTDRFEGALTRSIRSPIDSSRDSGRPTESADVFYGRCRKGTFVSCWTFGKKDNMALWQLFGGSGSSVAILTTTDRLTRTNRPGAIQSVSETRYARPIPQMLRAQYRHGKASAGMPRLRGIS
jgi:hypothetical protein